MNEKLPENGGIPKAAADFPGLADAMARLSPEDMASLKAALSDPAAARRILATPQAQRLIEQLTKPKNR